MDEKKVVAETVGQDIERGSISVVTPPDTETGNGHGVDTAGYHRKLNKRQIMMIVFGAGIGTGLWVGTGQALAAAGPGGIAVAYTTQAFVVWTMYMSIGEMTSYRPVHGGFIRQTAEYVDPALAFAEGINFWFAWVMIIPAEITAAVSILKFWPSSDVVPLAAYIAIFLVATALPNIFPIKIYGHFEYVMSWFKILAIFFILAYMFIMASGGVPATHGPLVFHYWKSPGAFNNGVRGIAKAFVQAAFSFGSAQHIAVLAGEAKRPRRTVRAVVLPIFWRIFSFFVLNVWMVGMCVPYDDTDLVSGKGTIGSPYVIALRRGNLNGLAHAINGFIFLTVISCGVTSIYIASRALTALADLKIIHNAFGRKDKHGRPWLAMVIAAVLGGGLCFLNVSSTTVKVYNWFSSLVAISAFLSWLTIIFTHIRFRQALVVHGVDLKTLTFRAPCAPYFQYFSIAIVLMIMGFEFYLALYPSAGSHPTADGFFSVYVALPLFIFDFVAYKLYFKTKMVKLTDIDFSEAKIFDEEERVAAEKEAAEEALLEASGVRRRRFNPINTVKNLVLG